MAANEEAEMAGSTLEKVRSEALRLSEAERAELAHTLVESLDGPADKDAESAWDAEILRRLAEIDAGTAELIDREEMRRRMQARMSRA
jgi:putative addiction module component (TIGR02574 family)